MRRSKSSAPNLFAGTIVHGPRGHILRDADGVCWRLSFVNGPAPDGLTGQVSVRGKLAGPDLIEAEYVAAHDAEI